MKPQDILFFVLLFFLLFKQSPKIAVFAGLLCLIFSIPLFSFLIFFTAERLIWYAAGCFLLAVFLYVKELR